MSVFFTTLFICLVAGAAVFLYVQYHIQLKKARGSERSPGVSLARRSFASNSVKPVSQGTSWRAVKVKTGLMCCQAAERLSGRVYLVTDAPDFPLKKCDSQECECRYVYMNDRRDGEERRETTEFLIKMNKFKDDERRKTKDRRQQN